MAFIFPTEAIRGALFRSGRSGAFARQRPSDVVELLNPDVPVVSFVHGLNPQLSCYKLVTDN